MSGVRELFPAACPACGRQVSSDGVAYCTNVIASLKAGIVDALALHTPDDTSPDSCAYCFELWPCETVERLGPLVRRPS